MNQEFRKSSPAPWYRARGITVIAMLAVIVVFFIVREHWEHLTGRWIYLLLLACPLMHLFHGGHSGHSGHGKPEGEP